MAYDNYMADRLRNLLREKSIYFEEKKMMGGDFVLWSMRKCALAS